MKSIDTIFAIPTYGLRDVGETLELYDDHFWANGHALPLLVFDDSSLINHDKSGAPLRAR